MQRRKFLIGLGVVSAVGSIAGCSSIPGGGEPASTSSDQDTSDSEPASTSSDQDTSDSEPDEKEPIYDESQVEELVLSLSLPEDKSRRSECLQKSTACNGFDAVYYPGIGNSLLIDVDIAETVSETREAFGSDKDSYRRVVNLTMGDQAFTGIRDNRGVTKFRHSNAIGVVHYFYTEGEDTEPQRDRSVYYAIRMWEQWQSVTDAE